MAILEARSLSQNYHDKPVISDINLRITPGETVVFVGPSGAGKSTALRCIAGLETIEAGEVLFAGETLVVAGSKPKSVSGQIGMVFQQFNLFPHFTAVENVALAPQRVKRMSRAEALDAARTLLDKVGLSKHYDHFPSELSGGQQQRVAIARALAMKPKVMLFDEPTSALDPEYTREVLEVMRTLTAEGMTSVIVTHEMAFAKKTADRIVFLDDGQIVEIGTASEIFENPQQSRTADFVHQSVND